MDEFNNEFQLFTGGRTDLNVNLKAFTHPTDDEEVEQHTVISTKSQGKFDDDVQALRQYYELKEGDIIDITRQHLLSIIPRQRPRKDAYATLIDYLKKTYNIELRITSRKHG